MKPEDDAVEPARATPIDSAPDAAPEPGAAVVDATPDEPVKSGPSTNRIVLWVVVGGIGVYLVGSGLFGILFK